jgi:hypothetical protein
VNPQEKGRQQAQYGNQQHRRPNEALQPRVLGYPDVSYSQFDWIATGDAQVRIVGQIASIQHSVDFQRAADRVQLKLEIVPSQIDNNQGGARRAGNIKSHSVLLIWLKTDSLPQYLFCFPRRRKKPVRSSLKLRRSNHGPGLDGSLGESRTNAINRKKDKTNGEKY